MNKLILDKENIDDKKITKKIKIDIVKRSDTFGITKIVIDILASTDLIIDYNLENEKYDIVFNIQNNVNLNLYESKFGDKGKIQYTFNLNDKSTVNVFKYNKVDTIREMVIVNLNGINSNFEYIFKSICTSKEVYDLVINHNNKNTISNITNHSVNVLDGKVSFQVSSYVDKGITGCIANQNNRIINLTNNKCEIRPNLYINEYDTVANHSALIGSFSKDELFYLQSRGINSVHANELLIKGFLLSDLNSKYLIKLIEKDIKDYWR